MGRAPCCDKNNVKKGPWSPEEDAKLKEFMDKHGTGGNWIALPQKAGLRRCGKSCRLRWLNYLRPNIKHGEFTEHEDRVICSMYASIGSRWSIIASQLPGRTDNDIKNYWNTKLKKKLLGSTTMAGAGPPPRAPRQNHPHQHRPVLLPYSSSPHSNYSNFFPGAGALLQQSAEALTLQPQDHYMLGSSGSLNPMASNNGASAVQLQMLHATTAHRQLQVKEECGSGGAMIAFGCGDQQSCSSSDGTQYAGGQYVHGGRHHGKEMSFDNNNNGYGAYGVYGNGAGAVEQEHKLSFQLQHQHEEQQQQQAQLDYSYEEIKQLLMTAAASGPDGGGGLIHDPELIGAHAGKLTMM
ncbi:Transcription factor RAX2 [Hordeum vulgare]|uniref:Predicted protein n=1 Tax=Hordeum vulgare subsp. vulgare TaxID=112509 RepID=F2DXP2_HORVV|nr:transcription factor RAX2-like [Hordeum vulgare subsp. vulgare]KAE8806290.1 Transcription factor RAX2 [Hordeum vulgare]BAJ99863.1 predicted protein [Hordeum vulgare subsp. vulgare]